MLLLIWNVYFNNQIIFLLSNRKLDGWLFKRENSFSTSEKSISLCEFKDIIMNHENVTHTFDETDDFTDQIKASSYIGPILNHKKKS